MLSDDDYYLPYYDIVCTVHVYKHV